MKRILTILLVFTALFVFSSCDKSLQAYTKNVFAMDTYMIITVYSDSKEKADATLNDCETLIHDIENHLSATINSSEVYALNRGQSVIPSEYLSSVLISADRIYSLTSGAFDITLYPVSSAWGFSTKEYTIPSESTLEALRPYIGQNNINVTTDEITLPDGFEIELGAIAKGYLGDMLTNVITEHDINSAVINLGGNVQTIGNKPDGSHWNVAIENPFSPSENICKVSVNSECVITSGNYERYFIGDDGKRYCHIIDPETLSPSFSGIVSATVIGDCGSYSDALSTALYVSGMEKAKEIYYSCIGTEFEFEMILITDENKIYYTEGLNDTFTNLSDMEAVMISER